MAFKNPNAKPDPFRKLGVSNEDKMTFFLLKWVFSAIKIDQAIGGGQYVMKDELVR